MAAFYAKKDPYGYPIPGTMMRFDHIPCNDLCNWVELETNPTVPSPATISYHPSKMRFFFRVCDGCVVPNSLIVSKNHPGGNVVEFRKYI